MEQSIWQEIGQLYHFMASQLKKSLSLEIEKFNVSQKIGFGFLF
ncbi:hypothetical protein [Paraprevotella xylaniphila]